MKKLSRNIRLVALAALTCFGAVGATGAITASPASAATAVTFCFKFQNPPTFSSYANLPVFLEEQLPHGAWQVTRQGRTNANGCATFYNTNPTIRLGVKAYTSTAYQTWESAWYLANPGNGTANMGTLPVFRTR